MCVCVFSGIVQGTRGLMLAAILLSFIAILVEMVGLRCTTCLADEPEQKDKVALAGGVIFIIAGQTPVGSDTHTFSKGAFCNQAPKSDALPIFPEHIHDNRRDSAVSYATHLFL